MKKLTNNLSLIIILSVFVLSSCKAENKEKGKREVVKTENNKEEVSESENQHAKPILIIGTASILYKFWFSKSAG